MKMPPKGKKRSRRRSRRIAGLNPSIQNTSEIVAPSTSHCSKSNGTAITTGHPSESDDSDSASSNTSPSLSSSPCLKQITNTRKRSSSKLFQSESSQSDGIDADISEIVKITPNPISSYSASSVVTNDSQDSSNPSSSLQSPNTELLVSNIELGQSQTVAQSQDSDPDVQDDIDVSSVSNSRGGSLNSQGHSNTPRTISLRSQNRRRNHSQSRAIMSAYRSFPSSLPVKGESFCDCPKTSRDLTCACGEEDTVFEWRWDPVGKSAACDLSDENRTAIFHVSYSSGTAAVKGSLPMNDRQYFWEVKMTSPVYGTDMMVGIGTANVNLDSFRHTFTSLLGRDGDSWGLSYYGRFQQKGQFKPINGAKFGQGSIIGLHVDMWHGTLSYYKNRKPLGILCSGLHGKTVYPMVSSTAARTTMKVIKACSFQTSLQFLCCQALRKMVPENMDVTDVVELPPGLRAFLANNLSWLLRPSELHSDFRVRRKRLHNEVDGYESSTEEEGDAPPKRFRFGTREDMSDASDLEDEIPVDLALPQT